MTRRWLSDDSPEESTQKVTLVCGWRPGCDGWLLQTHITTDQQCSEQHHALIHKLQWRIAAHTHHNTSALLCRKACIDAPALLHHTHMSKWCYCPELQSPKIHSTTRRCSEEQDALMYKLYCTVHMQANDATVLRAATLTDCTTARKSLMMDVKSGRQSIATEECKLRACR